MGFFLRKIDGLVSHEIDMPEYTAVQIAKQISKPYKPRYSKSRGMQINPNFPRDYSQIAKYFRDDESFSLILDYRSRLYNFIQKNGIQALEDEFELWIEHPDGLGKGKGQFSDDYSINKITGHFLKRFMKAFRSEIELETPLLVAQSKTKIWIGEPNKRSGPYLISIPQGLPMIDQHRKEILHLPCFFWSKSNSPKSKNSWVQPFAIPGYNHPPTNVQWVLYREFICTYSSDKRRKKINHRQVGIGPYGYFD